MTDIPKYPHITDPMLVPFRVIELQLKTMEDFLDRPECPYPPAIRLFLQQRFSGAIAPAVMGGVEYSEDDTIQEISDLYTELKRVAFRAGQVAGGDSKDQVAVLKTASDLLTKLVDLKAKAFTNRDMSRFQKTVVDILENTLTPAQRSQVIDQMGQLSNV
jgi:hypothetical protein